MLYIFPGLVIGAVYAILGDSIALTYSATGVLNLATGAIAYLVADTFNYLVAIHHWSLITAAPVCLAIGPALGVVLWALIFRRMEQTDLVVQVVATIGVAVALPAAAEIWMPVGETQQAPGIVPHGLHTVHFWFVTATRDQLAAVIGAAICVIALVLLLDRTRLGLSTRAVVDRPVLAQTRGINTATVSASSWALSGLLIAIGGILLCPLIDLDPGVYIELTVAALSVALVGRFRNLVVTAVAGLVLGVVNSLLIGYAPQNNQLIQGIAPALPFFLLTALLLLRWSPSTARRDAVQVQAATHRFHATIRPTPTVAVTGPPSSESGSPPRAARPKVGWLISYRPLMLKGFALVGLLLVGMFAFSDFWTTAIAVGLAFSVIFLSFTIATGEGAVVCLGQAAIVGVSGFLAGRLFAAAGVPLLLAAVIAVLAAGVVGVIIGVIGARLDQIGFALVTLAFALFCEKFVFNITSLDPAEGVPYPILKFPGLSQARSLVLLGFAVFVAVSALVGALKRRRLGRVYAALRGNPVSTESLGLNVRMLRAAAFAVGASVAGAGGVLLGLNEQQLGLPDVALATGLVWLAVVVVFGVRGPQGALLAGLATSLLPAGIALISSAGWVGNLPTLLFGLGAIGLATEPRGSLAPLQDKLRDVGEKWFPSFLTAPVGGASGSSHRRRLPHRYRARVAAPLTGSRPAADSPVEALSVSSVTVRFGGIVALHDVSLIACRREIIGLIGPNGAGKTTLLNVVSGIIAPESGTISIDGTTVEGLSVHQRARLGMSRTFQRVTLFGELSARQHLQLASEAAARAAAPPSGNGSETGAVRDRYSDPAAADALLARVGLTIGGDAAVTDLPLGRARLVELAMALAAEPRVLLLDEPFSGLASNERDHLSMVLARVRDQAEMAIVLVEHDIDVVSRLADRIVVLDFGEVIADGVPTDVLADTKVRQAYFGVVRAD